LLDQFQESAQGVLVVAVRAFERGNAAVVQRQGRIEPNGIPLAPLRGILDLPP
jgi:hypothetical protein